MKKINNVSQKMFVRKLNYVCDSKTCGLHMKRTWNAIKQVSLFLKIVYLKLNCLINVTHSNLLNLYFVKMYDRWYLITNCNSQVGSLTGDVQR